MKLDIKVIKNYWNENNIPQTWYSSKKKLSLEFFNEVEKERYNKYYPYLLDLGEFQNHFGEEVLEIGTGMGTDLIQFAKNGSKVYGIDLNEDQIAITKKFFEAKKLNYEDLKIGNAESLPYEDKKFDLVYSFGVIHHTADINKAVSEIFRVLKDDGNAIIMLYAKGWKHYFKRIFIHGILKMKILRYKFNFQRIFNEVSEVNGNSPQTLILNKKKIRELFKEFKNVQIHKTRLGEFFDYKPYQTIKFPKFISFLLYGFGLESIIGENYLVKLSKTKIKSSDSLFNVIFKHY